MVFPVLSKFHLLWFREITAHLFCPHYWLCFSEKICILFYLTFEEILQKALTDMGKFFIGMVVYSLCLFLIVPLNFRMHSTSSHDGHKHHRSQTLPIIRGKNALSNPKLLQMIDSSTASKYWKMYLIPAWVLWGLDQALYN